MASALRLRAKGFEVDVLESCPDPGGRARTFTINGHAFDAGPTVITAPWLFDELFELFGEDLTKKPLAATTGIVLGVRVCCCPDSSVLQETIEKSLSLDVHHSGVRSIVSGKRIRRCYEYRRTAKPSF